MGKRKKEVKKIGLIVAICFSGFGSYSDNVIIPLLNSIYTEYNDTNIFLQNFIISGSAVASIITAILAGLLMRYVSKRKLLIVGTIMFIFGGMAGFFTYSIPFLAFTRIIDAASDGLLLSVANSLIIELFQQKEERGKMLGWSNAASSIYGIIVSFLAGIIALYYWRAAFLLNSLSILSLILIILFVPETALEKKQTSQKKQEYPASKVDSRFSIFYHYLSLLIMGSCGCQLYLLIDLFVAERNLGTPALSGTLTSVQTLATILTCIIFSKIYAVTQKHTLALLYFTSGLALTFLVWSQNLPMLLFSSVLCGFSIGGALVYYPLYIGNAVSAEKVNFYISLLTAFQYIYMFIAPYLPHLIGGITGTISYSTSFLYTGIYLIIMAFATLLLPAIHYDKKN